jgi:cobalt/nickel transport system permease protein
LQPFAVYFPLCILLILTGRVSGLYLLWRGLAASPFILLASGLLAYQGGLPAAASVALKAYAAALLLAFLTASTALADLLLALRRLGSPDSLNLILGMMHRYTSLLSEEYARMERARDCRTVRPLGRKRFGVYARQLGTLILRSWDRSERIYAAMLARGFHGSWPVIEQPKLGLVDATFFALSGLLFLLARLLT